MLPSAFLIIRTSIFTPSAVGFRHSWTNIMFVELPRRRNWGVIGWSGCGRMQFVPLNLQQFLKRKLLFLRFCQLECGWGSDPALVPSRLKALGEEGVIRREEGHEIELWLPPEQPTLDLVLREADALRRKSAAHCFLSEQEKWEKHWVSRWIRRCMWVAWVGELSTSERSIWLPSRFSSKKESRIWNQKTGAYIPELLGHSCFTLY